MTMFEEAKSLYGMMKMRKATQSETAKMLGVSQSYVANKLRLLQLDQKMQDRICECGLSERHARTLLRIKDENLRREVLDKIIERRLSVSESEALCDLIKTSDAPKLIGKAELLEATDAFLKYIDSSMTALRSLGAGTSIKTSYKNQRLHISIFIDEQGKM